MLSTSDVDSRATCFGPPYTGAGQEALCPQSHVWKWLSSCSHSQNPKALTRECSTYRYESGEECRMYTQPSVPCLIEGWTLWAGKIRRSGSPDCRETIGAHPRRVPLMEIHGFSKNSPLALRSKFHYGLGPYGATVCRQTLGATFLQIEDSQAPSLLVDEDYVFLAK